MCGTRWVLLGIVATACQVDVPDVDVPRDAVDPGPYDTTTAVVELDLGPRSDGFPSRVNARVTGPLERDDDAPVVMFHHGFATEVEAYFRSASFLSTWGLVVVLPQWDLAAGSRTHAGLRDDAIAAMDALQRDGLELEGVAVDMSRFGMGGHSRGGKQALLAALADERVAAVFNLDPVDALPPFGEVDPEDYPSTTPELVGGLKVPMGQVGSGRGSEGTVPCAPADEGYAAIFARAPAGTLQFTLPTAGHNDFNDDCADGTGGVFCNVCPAGDDPAAALRFGRASLAAFFKKHLEDDDGFDGWLEGEEPFELVADAIRSVK